MVDGWRVEDRNLKSGVGVMNIPVLSMESWLSELGFKGSSIVGWGDEKGSGRVGSIY